MGQRQPKRGACKRMKPPELHYPLLSFLSLTLDAHSIHVKFNVTKFNSCELAFTLKSDVTTSSRPATGHSDEGLANTKLSQPLNHLDQNPSFKGPRREVQIPGPYKVVVVGTASAFLAPRSYTHSCRYQDPRPKAGTSVTSVKLCREFKYPKPLEFVPRFRGDSPVFERI